MAASSISILGTGAGYQRPESQARHESSESLSQETLRVNRGSTAGAGSIWEESHLQQFKYSEHLKSLIFLTDSCVSYVATVADVAGGLEKDFSL